MARSIWLHTKLSTVSVPSPPGRCPCVDHILLCAAVGIFDPSNDTFTKVLSETEYGSSTGGTYSGAILAQDGQVYFVPSNADSMGVIDPATDTFSILDAGSFAAGDRKFAGGVLAPNGKVHGCM